MSSAVDSVVKKMLAVKENTEEANERESDAKAALKGATLTVFAKENEVEGLRRRVQCVRLRLNEVNAEIEEKSKVLEEVEERAKLEEEKGKDLNYAEVETDEYLRSIEIQVKEAHSVAESSQMKLNDAQRRLTILESEFSRAEIRKDAAFKRIAELEQMMKEAGESLRKLEQEGVVASEKDNDNEKKIQILQEDVAAKTRECEDSERSVEKSERRIDALMKELEHWHEKKRRLEDEIGALGELQ